MTSEERVERVFAGLRDAEAPAGMERRIVAALAARRESRHGGVRRMLASRLMWGSVAAVGLAGVMVLVLGVPRARHAGVASTGSSLAAGIDRGGDSLGPRVVVRRAARPAVRPAAKTLMRGAAESVAVSEMRAASYPAPPMPLTEEEKLLLRVAHRGDEVELAALNPEKRERLEAQGKKEVQEFFDSSATGTAADLTATGQATTGESE